MTKLKTSAVRWAQRLCGFGRFRRLARDEKGTTAIEFGLIAAPFLAMMFAIIETALVFFAGQTLETAVADSARLIMTGQAQTQSFDQAKFKTAVCAQVHGLFDCASGIKVDVRSYSSFSVADMKKPIDDKGKLIEDFQYVAGGPCDIVVVRVMYQWPVWVPLLGFNLADMAGGNRLLMGTVAFRNEPYGTTSCA